MNRVYVEGCDLLKGFSLSTQFLFYSCVIKNTEKIEKERKNVKMKQKPPPPLLYVMKIVCWIVVKRSQNQESLVILSLTRRKSVQIQFIHLSLLLEIVQMFCALCRSDKILTLDKLPFCWWTFNQTEYFVEWEKSIFLQMDRHLHYIFNFILI